MANHRAQMNISLPGDLKEYVQNRTKEAHFGTPSDYMRSLIRDDMRHVEQERLEYDLLKGIHSGKPTEMTPQKYEAVRKRLRAKAAKK
ncbi:MAG: type II toxin-antitoxin system ParD family antitoxin [Candidatus Sungbacteria bacterium]|nr:type II toxin-antitoxin system ParD family antitoxin [Candidatus Sungbacteria bacterium]